MAPPPPPSAGDRAPVVLDHVAIAVERWADAWPRYVHQLGGSWHSGGANIGFSPAQLTFANGAKVEVLQPWEPENNDFLRRFLDHSGPGPHHLTFKVPDINAALERVRAAGFDPVNVRLSDPQWREAFLHPRQATGVVVQLAQEEFDWISPAPEGFPETEADPASLLHVTHVVRALDRGLALFHELLEGEITGRGSGPFGLWDFVDVAWPGALGLRLVAPGAGAGAGSPLATWLGDRQGRVHHLAFTCPGPPPGGSGAGDTAAVRAGDIPGVIPGPGSVQVVEPGDNLGTRLVLVAPV